MRAKEILELVSKQWCNLNDLIMLTGLGRNNALKLKNDIKTKLINDGYYLPKNLLPMVEVVKYLKIDLNYLREIA